MTQDSDRRRIITQARRDLPALRRRAGWLGRLRLRRRPPWWAFTGRDDLLQHYFAQGRLLRQGELVWGVVVQANTLLFQDDDAECPGVLAYSADTDWSDDPGELDTVARELFRCKQDESSADPDVQFIGQRLRDERGRYNGTIVPKSLTGGRDVKMTSVMFYRRDLPAGKITARAIPILIDPAGPTACILPGPWWPEAQTADRRPAASHTQRTPQPLPSKAVGHAPRPARRETADTTHAWSLFQQTGNPDRFDDALDEAERLLAQAPHHLDALYLKALCLANTDSPAAAATTGKLIVDLEPDRAVGYHARSFGWLKHFTRDVDNLRMQLDNTDDRGRPPKKLRSIIEDYRKAIALQPDWDALHTPYAWALFLAHRFDEACDAARHALSLDTADTWAREVLCRALRAQGKTDEAVAAAQAIPDDAASVPLFKALRGWAELEAGQRDAAYDSFVAAFRQDPDNAPASQGIRSCLKARFAPHGFIQRRVLRWNRDGRGNRRTARLWLGLGLLTAALVAWLLYDAWWGQMNTPFKKALPLIIGVGLGAFITFALRSHLCTAIFYWASRGASDTLLLTSRAGRIMMTPWRRWVAMMCLGTFVPLVLLPFAVVGGLIAEVLLDHLFALQVSIKPMIPYLLYAALAGPFLATWLVGLTGPLLYRLVGHATGLMGLAIAVAALADAYHLMGPEPVITATVLAGLATAVSFIMALQLTRGRDTQLAFLHYLEGAA
ncbi:hypothetical protein OT109_14995 [Phycisphaeraceae bacterium D3-23]